MSTQTRTSTNERDILSSQRGHKLCLALFRIGLSAEDLLERLVQLSDGLVLGREGLGTGVLVGTSISRRHALICRRGEHWEIEDLGSKNGTIVNGQRIKTALIEDQTVVRLGEWVGCVCVLPAPVSEDRVAWEVAPGLFGGVWADNAVTQLRAIAQTELRLLLQGETGTGKEVFSRLFHEESKRRGPRVVVNCSAIPENLAEGELFGYRKGAFSGAERASFGHFRSANGGTLFLDEVQDLVVSVQAKLLRVLEQREVVPLGQSSAEDIDVRICAASQLPLHEAVSEGRFRADLYSRLYGAEIVLPPLRERREEIVPFLRYRFGSVRFTAEALEQLLLYDWPWNVRELLQLTDRIVANYGTNLVLSLDRLPEKIARYTRGPVADSGQLDELDDPTCYQSKRRPVNVEQLLAVLNESGGNISVAAVRLGISRPRAYRLLRRLPGFDPKQFRLRRLDE